MYSGSGFSDWEIGDISVHIEKGIYHLFHLIIPNHDYIAHAVSRDGISWKRVNNALFVGNPGDWDDDMLWTMHVVGTNGKYEMYYTGLQRKDRGIVSKVGFAESDNMIDWKKNSKNFFPLGPKGIYYETHQSNPRTWLSFRDPFYFEYNNDKYLLVATRTIAGPVSRRGCVGLVKITNDCMELMPPLLYPRMYDDIECPCIFYLGNRYFIIGSIREDIKVRYWYADDFFGNYQSFTDDVLLPVGNYAARTVQDGEHLLLYNFFYTHGKINSLRVLPPPKQLVTDQNGRLQLKTYYRWEKMISQVIQQPAFGEVKELLQNPAASFAVMPHELTAATISGYGIFVFKKPSPCFIWEGILTVEGTGKTGIVTDIDQEGNGYFISLDINNGSVSIRSWGFNPLNHRQNFIFDNIQSNRFTPAGQSSLAFRLIRYGSYIEFSINDIVKLTLIDYTFSGEGMGLYTASSGARLQQSVIKILPEPGGEYASQEEAEKNS